MELRSLVRRTAAVSAMLVIGFSAVDAQQAITASGGDAANYTCSLSFSMGEVAVLHSIAPAVTVVNITESFSQGVQQPYTTRDQIPTTGISPLDVEMRIYPNPTTNNVVLERDSDEEPLHYILYSANGVVLEEGDCQGASHTLVLERYGSGSYLLSVSSQDRRQSNKYKIIKK